jgi:hypothetical protein
MAHPPQPPAPPAKPPQQPAQPARPQVPAAAEPHPPQKYDRPLPQPGDKDYVVGQPVDEEEASRVEKEDEERFAHGQAEAHRQDDKDSKR